SLARHVRRQSQSRRLGTQGRPRAGQVGAARPLVGPRSGDGGAVHRNDRGAETSAAAGPAMVVRFTGTTAGQKQAPPRQQLGGRACAGRDNRASQEPAPSSYAHWPGGRAAQAERGHRHARGRGAGAVLVVMLFLRAPTGGRPPLPRRRSRSSPPASGASPSFNSPGGQIELLHGEVKVLVPKSTLSPNKSSLTRPGKQLQLQVQMDWRQ
ncbi:unnamed protein product, partial [Urochloa humidicola]